MSELALCLLALAACAGEDDESNATATVTTAVSPTATASASPSPTATVEGTVTVTPTPQVDFERTGNLVRDNPGLPPGVWFLVYEQAGAPALTVELAFDAASECVTTSGPVACGALEPGSRAAVAGVESEQLVRVVRLEVLAPP